MKKRPTFPLPLLAIQFLAFCQSTECYLQYRIASGEIRVDDEETGLRDIRTLFLDEDFNVVIQNIEWNLTNVPLSSSSSVVDTILRYQLLLGNNLEDSGEINLRQEYGVVPPPSIPVGRATATSRGSQTVQVILEIRTESLESTQMEQKEQISRTFQTYRPIMALLPLLVVLMISMTTKMVELSLSLAIFVGACLVEGGITNGFMRSLEDYLVEACANRENVQIILLTVFMSGFVALMERSGGLRGFADQIRKYASTPTSVQLITFLAGCLVFFDDYSNILVVGLAMRPLLDAANVSREKLAFLVDNTSSPIASLSPISSWVGFEIGLISSQLERLREQEGDDLTITTSAFDVFMQTIRFRYYTIFILLLLPTLALTQRDFGPMLIAERKARVIKRITAGANDLERDKFLLDQQSGLLQDGPNGPDKDTPLKSWNLFVPLLFLIVVIIYLLQETGDDGELNTFIARIENSNSYQATLWATLGAAVFAFGFYWLQFKQDGRIVSPSIRYFCMSYPVRRPLITLAEAMESFLFGVKEVFPAVIILVLGWAVGSATLAVGTDRIFATFIVNSKMEAGLLPTFAFCVAFFVAFATGSTWGTMSILFPLLIGPTYDSSNGNPDIVYQAAAGIFAGSVGGDHLTTISDTTVMSALATGCNLVDHLKTQAPYIIAIFVVSVAAGTLPVGFGAYPSGVAFIVGYALIFAFVYGVCKPILNETGSFDFLTELFMRHRSSHAEALLALKMETQLAFQRMSKEPEHEDMEDISTPSTEVNIEQERNAERGNDTHPESLSKSEMEKNRNAAAAAQSSGEVESSQEVLQSPPQEQQLQMSPESQFGICMRRHSALEYRRSLPGAAPTWMTSFP